MILDNIERVRREIEQAAERAGRDPKQVELLAVTKYAKVDQISELLKSGKVRQIGESRIQDAEDKKARLKSVAAWRLIGHLQTNKAKKALEIFDTIDSLDSLKLAEDLNRRLSELGKRLPVLVQVKVTGKESQNGIPPESLDEFLKQCRRFSRLEVQGLMTIAPMSERAEQTRPYFRRVRQLWEQHFPQAEATRAVLSMGMSRDFEIAIEEGSTMVRIGTALFASRT